MRRLWPLSIRIDRQAPTPLGQQIVHAVIDEIRAGRLKPGTLLPSTRELAEGLAVNRKTLVTAFAELEAQGWLTCEARRGTFVAEHLPLLEVPQARRRPTRPTPAVEAPYLRTLRPLRQAPPLVADLRPAGMLAFDDGAPELRHVPIDALARAYRDGLRSTLQRRRLGYGDPQGSQALRKALAAMLNAERGLTTSADNLCLTRGSQNGIHVVAQTLVAPGDTVVFERLSYPPAREAFRRAGAEIAAVGVDDQGLVVDDLERLCRRRTVRAVYVTPHHHFPTTVCLSPERRMRLMRLAAQCGFAIVEDDYDHDFHFTHQPMLPLAAFDDTGSVIYVGSMSKLLSPSLRIGYVSAPRAVIDRMASAVLTIDRQGDPAMEAAMAEFIDAGELHRHTRKMLKLYAERRERLAEFLHRHLGSRIEMIRPDGGLAYWVKLPDVDTDALLAHAHRHRLHVQSPRAFTADGQAVSALRLGFASLDVDELRLATRRLAAALADLGA